MIEFNWKYATDEEKLLYLLSKIETLERRIEEPRKRRSGPAVTTDANRPCPEPLLTVYQVAEIIDPYVHAFAFHDIAAIVTDRMNALLTDRLALAKLRERLEEAEWWAEGSHDNVDGNCKRCKRIADLRNRKMELERRPQLERE